MFYYDHSSSIGFVYLHYPDDFMMGLFMLPRELDMRRMQFISRN